jgi:uncharacterized protein
MLPGQGNTVIPVDRHSTGRYKPPPGTVTWRSSAAFRRARSPLRTFPAAIRLLSVVRLGSYRARCTVTQMWRMSLGTKHEEGVAQADSPPAPHQYSLPVAIVLHLFPGAALTLWVLAAAQAGMEPAIALFLGIGLVIVPLELGYLFIRARVTTGTWSLATVVHYRRRLPLRTYVLLGFALYLWFLVMLVISLVLLDEWIADTFFAWLPDSILQFAALEVDDADTPPVAVLIILIAIIVALNGVAGPLVEELYFRGHLLPGIDRYGKSAPVINVLLFSLYHFWTPWQNPGRIIGLLPWVYAVWKTQSLALAIIVHMAVNLTFVLILVTALLAG